MSHSPYPENKLVQSLYELAMDLHWSWSHSSDKLWQRFAPDLWESTRNPLVVLQTISKKQVKQVLSDPMVRAIVEELMEVKKQNAVSPAWFQKAYPGCGKMQVVYFSMEFMLSEALPIYSGGLGNVAGDLLKTASDLGVPLTGIGLLYQQGYPRQVIYPDGNQQYVHPFNDPGQLPVSPLRNREGEWLRIQIRLPAHPVWLRCWTVQVGRVNLLLLDTNDPANSPVHRGITSQLYGDDQELRFLQELVLGIGGWQLIRALGLNPQVCHLNEGHTALAVVERARCFTEDHELSFQTALAITRAGNIFTTHTAVGAGFDRFPGELIERYLGTYIRDKLRISFPEFMALGQQPGDEADGLFNMGYLAVRGSGAVNGVSKLHGSISKQLMAPLFPGWPVEEVPVGHVTNGVHMPTWDSSEADNLWTEACGKDRWLGSLENLREEILAIPDQRLWAFRLGEQEEFIAYIRARYSRQLAITGGSLTEIKNAMAMFDPGLLTIGFARRFAGYKRPNLLLKDPARLRRILDQPGRPVQLIIAGKAHPSDEAGQAMVREWYKFINGQQLAHLVVFMADYDMQLSERLVQGVDLWINTPRRPWEGCGTSGMKVLVNGGLNLSELDGWWDEAYDPSLGWAIGNREDYSGNEAAMDEADASRLYDLLEQEIVPEFYNRNSEGIPEGWVKRMRQSMAQLTPAYSSNRALRQYTEDYYLPAFNRYLLRSAKEAGEGRRISEWQNMVAAGWSNLKFGELKVEARDGQYSFMLSVFIPPSLLHHLRVELFAKAAGSETIFLQVMQMQEEQQGGASTFWALVPADRPADHYTPRIRPFHPGLSLPLEAQMIIWYK